MADWKNFKKTQDEVTTATPEPVAEVVDEVAPTEEKMTEIEKKASYLKSMAFKLNKEFFKETRTVEKDGETQERHVTYASFKDKTKDGKPITPSLEIRSSEDNYKDIVISVFYTKNKPDSKSKFEYQMNPSIKVTLFERDESGEFVKDANGKVQTSTNYINKYEDLQQCLDLGIVSKEMGDAIYEVNKRQFDKEKEELSKDKPKAKTDKGAERE